MRIIKKFYCWSSSVTIEFYFSIYRQLFLWSLYVEGPIFVSSCNRGGKKTTRSCNLGKISLCESLLVNHCESGIVKSQLNFGFINYRSQVTTDGILPPHHLSQHRRARVGRRRPKTLGEEVRSIVNKSKPFPVYHVHRVKSKAAST